MIMRYLQTFSTSGAVQEALDAELLGKPYCALVENNLDWDTLSPASPSYLGVWSDNGDGTYKIELLTADITTKFDHPVKIAEIDGFNENNEPVTWSLYIFYNPQDEFFYMGADYVGLSDMTDIIVDERGRFEDVKLSPQDESDFECLVYETGEDGETGLPYIVYSSSNSETYPLDITTINPIDPDGE